ncbi:MAG: PEP-CTERM sorting domain-containing protein [Pirellulales bacterium]
MPEPSTLALGGLASLALAVSLIRARDLRRVQITGPTLLS